jgi:4-hydroxybenzoate polyprenyltransferase
VKPRRSRARAYLALARVSNLPTVWTNVLAGMVLAGGTVSWPLFAGLAGAVSLLYTGGMFLNDAFDHRFDAAHRRDRPIPAGEATSAEAFAVGAALVVLGVAGVGLASGLRGAVWAAVLASAIVYYDWRHKRDPLGPLVMGVCRGLVYAVAGHVGAWAIVMTIYVSGVTLLAKHGDRRWGWTIAWWIAAISIVDATAIAAAGVPNIALIALGGFPLTLVAQRWVRGT